MPPYATILDLDGRIRDFPVPHHLRFSKDDGESSTLHLQRWLLHFYKETSACIIFLKDTAVPELISTHSAAESSSVLL
jgi:hypothetical protein